MSEWRDIDHMIRGWSVGICRAWCLYLDSIQMYLRNFFSFHQCILIERMTSHYAICECQQAEHFEMSSMSMSSANIHQRRLSNGIVFVFEFTSFAIDAFDAINDHDYETINSFLPTWCGFVASYSQFYLLIFDFATHPHRINSMFWFHGD